VSNLIFYFLKTLLGWSGLSFRSSLPSPPFLFPSPAAEPGLYGERNYASNLFSSFSKLFFAGPGTGFQNDIATAFETSATRDRAKND
jgi:hypothetical protein